MKINGLDHLVLTVNDLERSLAFYGEILGLPVIHFGNGRRALQLGSQKINLHRAGAEISPHAAVPRPGSADLCLLTETLLEQVAAKLAAAGVEPLGPPVERTGARGPIGSLYLRDPDGNLLEISRYLEPGPERQWQLKRFGQLAADELHRLYRLRQAVFIVEQRCPYGDIDDQDLTALHLYATTAGVPVAYCRIIAAVDGSHIGRVLVAVEERGRGLARELMGRALAACAPGPVWVQAQAHLQNFYGTLGFQPRTAVYLEDGIPHLDMCRPAD